MTNSTEKTTAEAERDVAEAREQLESTLGELEGRLAPEAMVEDALNYFRGDGKRYADALMHEARANPLPMILVGVGLAWLAISSRRQTHPQDARRDRIDGGTRTRFEHAQRTGAYGRQTDMGEPFPDGPVDRLTETAETSYMEPTGRFGADALHDVNTAIEDILSGYATLVDRADAVILPLVRDLESLHRRHATEIQARLAVIGEDTDDGSVRGVINKMVTTVKDWTSDLDSAVLPTVRNGEELLLSVYDSVIETGGTDVPAADRDMVARQAMEVREKIVMLPSE